MGRSRVAPEPPDAAKADERPEGTAVERREVMLRSLGLAEELGEERQTWIAEMHESKLAAHVDEGLEKTDKAKKKKDRAKIEARKMKRFNAQLCLRLVYYSAKGEVHAQMTVEDSIYLTKLVPAVRQRLGLGESKIHLLWCTPSGDTVRLTSQREFDEFVEKEWCTMPWVLHVHDASKSAESNPAIALVDEAKVLFRKFDVNNDGTIDRSELSRMLKTLDIRQLPVSAKSIDKYVDKQFDVIDKDASNCICLEEFTSYVTSMTGWMRDELMAESNRRAVFATLAARAVEVRMPRMELPPPEPVPELMPSVPNAEGPPEYSVISAPSHGLRLLVPHGALKAGTGMDASKISLTTLAPERVLHLSEHEARRQGEFAFSPVVQIDYPTAAADGSSPPMDATFEEPLTLVIPHAFSDNQDEAMESLVMLGARHGADGWKYMPKVDIDSPADPPIQHTPNELRVKVHHPGTFCAFSNPDVEDIARVRIYIFALPTVARDTPTTIRVYLCPELPDQQEEMRLADSSEWGISKLVGQSAVVPLYQGVCFGLSFQNQARIFKWHGSRVQTAFTWSPTDIDPEAISVTEHIKIDILEGEGMRASRVAAVAKRLKQAGIPADNWALPFTLTPKPTIRPLPPQGLEVVERTAWDFVLTYRPPPKVDGEKPMSITHYSLELSIPGASGTYGPFIEIWQGEALEHPNYLNPEYEKLSDEKVWLAEVKREYERKAANVAGAAPEAATEGGGEEEGAATVEGEGGAVAEGEAATTDGAVGGEGGAGAGANGAAAAEEEEEEEAPPTYMFFLDVAPELSGRLRMRCWCEDELRPSGYSEEAKLPKWLMKVDVKDQARRQLEKRREVWMGEHDIPLRSKNEWTSSVPTAGGVVAAAARQKKSPPPKVAKNSLAHLVPYALPMPRIVAGLVEAGRRLARLFEEIGVPNGAKGLLFGMHIDHILYAVTIGRVQATTAEPLMAVLELAYSDIMLPMMDEVTVMNHEWGLVIEKLSGIVTQVLSFAPVYDAVESSLFSLLLVLLELYETMRQCEADMLLALHTTDVEYSQSTRSVLKTELVDHICSTLWSLSIEILKLQITGAEAMEHESDAAIASEDAHSVDMIQRMQVVSYLAKSATGRHRTAKKSLWSSWKH